MSLPTTLAAQIQPAIEAGLGAAASVIGQPFYAYRVGAGAAGDFPSGWTALPGIAIKKKRIADAKLESSLKSGGTLFYEILADLSSSLLGDVFVNGDAPFVSGSSYGAGATFVVGSTDFDGLALSWHPPVSKAAGARLNARARIFRAALTPQSRNPNRTRWDDSQAALLPLVLTAGAFSFGAAGGAASWVPAGLGASERPASAPEFGSKGSTSDPATTPEDRAYVYLPPLPGYTPREADRMEAEDGSRYVLVQPYAQGAGVVGAQMVATRVLGGTG